MLAFEGFLSTPAMVALLDQRALVQSMMDVEAALSRAQGRCGLVPTAAAAAIASLCRVELYDVAALAADSARSGSLAASVVDKLRETAALFDPVAASYVHWGACVQDVTDTAMVLQTRAALGLIEAELLLLCSRLLDLADHRHATPMLVRAQLRPVAVGSLNLQLAQWVAPLLRSAQALRSQADEALVLQLGGAAGSLWTLGDAGRSVVAAVAAELHLPVPVSSWHSQRDRWVRLGAELGVLCGSLAKLARDLSLLSLPELGEVSVCSPSTAASLQQHHPAACMQALAAAQRAPQRVAALLSCMPQEHEQGLGNWQAELAEWSGLLLSGHGAVRGLAAAAEGLKLKPSRMLENIDLQRDLVFGEALQMLLLPHLGPVDTRRAMEALRARVLGGEGPLRRVASAWLAEHASRYPGVRAQELTALFDAQLAARHADACVAPLLAQARAQCAQLLRQPHFSKS